MIDRSLALHSTLAAAAALVAYVAWVSPRFARDDNGVEIIAGKPEALDEIGWQDKATEVSVRRAGADVQVVITNKPKGVAAKVEPAANTAAPSLPGSAATSAPAASSSPAPASASPAASPATTPSAKVFPASAVARELFTELAPLSGLRRLGQVDAEHLRAFGLTTPEATLRLRFGTTEHTLKVGSATFGSGQTYVQSASGEVYLVKATLLADLKSGATVLTERALVPVARDKVEKVTLATGPKSRDLVQRFREDPSKAFWADPAEPNGKLTQAGNWIDRLLRTRLTDLASKKPEGAPALSAELYGEGRALGKVAIWLPTDGDALATSSTFATPVTLPKWVAEALVKDVEALLEEKPQ